MKTINLVAIILIILLGLSPSVFAANSTFFPVGAPVAPVVDVVNSTAMDWIYYLLVSNKTPSIWEFPTIAFSYDLMLPFTTAFGGFAAGGGIVYLILWGVFLMSVWRQSGKITMPSMIAVITAGAMSLLIPQYSQPWCMLLLSAAIASQLLTFFAKE
jgi:hypothetical protein